MSAADETSAGEPGFTLDRANLYQEETFTDLKSGSVKRFTPIKPDGTVDKSRHVVYVGHTNVVTAHGPLPIHHPIKAKDLAQAFKRFPEAMEEALQALIAEAKRLSEQKENPLIQTPDSRIIVP